MSTSNACDNDWLSEDKRVINLEAGTAGVGNEGWCRHSILSMHSWLRVKM